MEIKSRFFHDNGGSFFLFGPRGTGKSTFLKAAFPHAYYIDLLTPELFRKFSARPERLIEVVEGNLEFSCFIIDEIQRIPSLLVCVHQLIERYKNVRFILTGSSARKLKRSGVDLLAGRAYYKTFHPFMVAELGTDFSLQKNLITGTIPLVIQSTNPQFTLEAYIKLYLEEEIKAEGLVRNIGTFSRFLEAVSFSCGSILNSSEVARECETGRKNVENYISILEDLLIAYTIPVFSKRAKRNLIVHPKFYFFDAGVFRTLRPKGPLDNPGMIDGVVLETFVATQLRAYIALSNKNLKLYYWRTKSGVEIDFVIYGEDTLYAIEVKLSSEVRRSDLSGLLSFKEDYPETKLLFLYMGKEQLLISGVTCIPCENFLKNLLPGKAIMEKL